jgi:hypothetical protein
MLVIAYRDLCALQAKYFVIRHDARVLRLLQLTACRNDYSEKHGSANPVLTMMKSNEDPRNICKIRPFEIPGLGLRREPV